MACNSKASGGRLQRSEILNSGTLVTYMGQYSLHLLHYLSSLGYFGLFGLQMSKLGLVASATSAVVATYLLGINLNCSNLVSDQAERQGAWAPCYFPKIFEFQDRVAFS